jgi:hypothetical protein
MNEDAMASVGPQRHRKKKEVLEALLKILVDSIVPTGLKTDGSWFDFGQY